MSRREIIDKMIDIFSKGGRQNVTLIGTAGVGKTTIVKAFAEELLDADMKITNNLKYRQIVMLDANALISAAGGEGKLERLMTMIVNEAYSAKNIILCLDNAQLFFEEGAGSVDLSNFFTPIIEAGRLRMIMMMNEQRFLKIAANNPNLANCLNQVMIAPTNKEETIRIMQDNALEIEAKFGVVLTYLALKEAYRLSERYIHDMDMPGRAINLLETAASYAENGLVTERSVRVAIEKTKGVKLNVSETNEEKETLLNLEGLIHKRMIDQEEAVKTVSDALRRAAAGVRSQSRPIGTFLFLGPTGVGKTELAKALAQVYFKGEGNIVRLDMNEYVTESDVARLLADGKDFSESLVAQVMKKPFSVVLLDEIEKAHPAVLTTLLQLLDEGILRDINNREVSFRDAIVIATSNAGADRIREYVKNGEDLAKMKAELIEEIIHSGQFKPEFVNRFDEICVFKPLGMSELREIVKLIIGSVNKTLEPRKISVVLDDEGINELVRRGYDPMMGARPMKRIVQKTVENIIAKKILGDEIGDGAVVKITKDMLF
ncbi:ATP-dependent Clp protease ATP-binding subunit [Candidatus Saccharibacteria bacterium]|nr:ATP-dependent Clp protease ATP-binding subunit [Candidatus Saccharibacteria bacterium]